MTKSKKDIWVLPDIVIDGDHVCYDYTENHINLGIDDWENTEHISAPTATPEEMFIACLIHEITHWAQTQGLSKTEKNKIEKVYRKIDDKEKALIERHAVEIEDDWFEYIGKPEKS